MAKTQHSLRAQQVAPIFRLPPELRNYIYELVLEDAGDIKLRLMSGANAIKGEKSGEQETKKSPKKNAKRPPKLSFFMTCRQIRSETMSMVYSRIRLSVELPPDPSLQAYRDALRKALLEAGGRQNRAPVERHETHLESSLRLAKELDSILQKLLAAFPPKALRSILHISFKDGEAFRRFYMLDRDLCDYTRYIEPRGPNYKGLIARAFPSVTMITVNGNELRRPDAKLQIPMLSRHLHQLRFGELCGTFPALKKIRAVNAERTLQRYRVEKGQVYIEDTGRVLESWEDVMKRELGGK